MAWSGKYENFLKVLKASLNLQTEPLYFQELEWDFIFSTACRHCVESVIFDYIENLPADSGISPALAAKWYSSAIRDERNFSTMTAVVAGQRETWEKGGIDAVLLKGLECSAFYPVPHHRALGDIDWWMKTDKDWNKALDMLRGRGIKWQVDSDGDISYCLGGVLVEHHRKGLVADSPEGRLLYLAEHIFHHAAVYGVGIRQICDYALASRKLTVDRDSLYHLARKRGYGHWLQLLDRVSGTLLYGSEPDRKTGRFLYNVLEDGNFGKGGISLKRIALAGSFAPGRLLARWAGLAIGRIKRF